MSFTSNTAPGKTFSSRSEIAEHYKSDWHKYNLKRREAGLQLVSEKEFQMRLEAALAMRKEKEKKNGTDHIKNINSKKNKKKQKNVKAKAEEAKKSCCPSSSSTDAEMTSADNTSEDAPKFRVPAALAKSQENPEIDPKQCLFDQHKSKSLKENVHYMQQKYGFFLPDKEFIVDLEGLLGYCHEKIKLGHYCLYCNQVFPTWQGCQQHMIDKQHAKLRYEQGFWEELDPFYDFSSADKDFAAKIELDHQFEEEKDPSSDMDVDGGGDEDGWEDMSDGDDGEEEEMYDGYEKEIKRFGLKVNTLGELVFPDGRVVGHRALRRYYNQKLSASTTTSLAVVAAQKASGERLYNGRVVNIHDHNLKHDKVRGAGKGILVAIGGEEGGPAAFSALSLYRYRAAIRKQRRGDFKGNKIREKAFQNINRMDKKANRLMNGVSVAHAAR